MDQIFDLITQFIQAGFGLWSIVLFFQVRRLKKAEATKDTRDIWEKIAESNNDALLKQNDEIRFLRQAVGKLEKIIYRLPVCVHFNGCPSRRWVQEYKTYIQKRAKRVTGAQQENNRHPRDQTGIDSPDQDSGGEPP